MQKKLHKIIADLKSKLDKSTLKQLKIITESILSMRGRVTMLGISRWSEGSSYKTIERFFDKKLDWLSLKWKMIERVIGKEVILVADETTVSKSGKETYGLGYFYSGIHNRAIKGISFLSFSIVDVENRRAYPLFTKQMKKTKREKVEKKSKRRGVGRPRGSKTQPLCTKST